MPPQLERSGSGKDTPPASIMRLELVDRVQVLAGRDRQAALARDPDVALDVVRNGRLLEPGDLMRGQRARCADRHVRAPAHVGIDHQREVGPEQLAHRADPLDVLGQTLAADLHLDRPETLGEVVLGLAEQLIERELQIDAAGIGGHLSGRGHRAGARAAGRAAWPSGPRARCRSPRSRARRARPGRRSAGAHQSFCQSASIRVGSSPSSSGRRSCSIRLRMAPPPAPTV